MLRKIASIHFVVGVMAAASLAHAGPANPPTVESALTSAVPAYSRIDVKSVRPTNAGQAQHTDVPSAPLPPALWPGLALLLVLGSVKFAHQIRRGLVRI